MASDGTIKISTDLDTKDAKQAMSQFSGEAEKGLSGMKDVAIASAAAFAGVAASIGAAAAAGIKYNAAMEQYQGMFETMLGSAEKAYTKMDELKVFAAATPFEMSDLASATTTLLSFGIASDDTTDILKQLGDVSLGNKDKFNSLAVVYGQVSSQGKLMGQDLMQCINAGFNPLQVISERTGKSMADLKDEMSNGAISAEMVAQAFQWATEEGGMFAGGMEKQSQTMDGLMSTLKDNALAVAGDVVKPLSDSITNELLPSAIKAIDDVSKELSEPKMKESLDNIGDGMADLAVSATKLATKAIPPLISIVDGAVKSFDVLAPAVIMTTAAMGAIKGVSAFTKAMDIARDTLTLVGNSTELMTVTIGKKAAAEAMATAATKANMTVNAAGQLVTSAGTIATAAETTAIVANTGAVSLKTLALGVMTGQIGFATAAQVLWNAAMTANPIGLIIVGVSTLIAGVFKLTKVLGEESDAGKKTQETVEELQKDHDKLKQSIDASKTSYDESTSSIDANAKKAENLIEKIKDMSAVTEKNAGQVKLLKGWVSDLNSIMPELSISYNEQTGEVEGLNASTENRIRLIKEEAKTEAQRKYLTELYEQQAEAEIQLQIAQEELTSATKEHGEEAYRTWSNAEEWQRKYMWSMLEMDAVFGPLSDHQAVLQDDLKGINSEISVFEQNIADTTVDSAISELEQLDAACGDSKTAVAEYSEEQISALGGLQDEYTTLADTATNMFDKISRESKISLDEMIANLEYNQEVTAQWADNMAKLAEAGMDNGLLEKLRQAGPESAVLVADLVKSMEIGDDKWQEISNLYAKGAAETVTSFAAAYGIKDTVAAEVAGMVETANTALTTSVQAAGFGITGTNTVNEFAQGLQNGVAGVASVSDTIVSTAASVTTGTKLEFDKSTVNLDTYTKSVSGLMDNLTTGLTGDQAAQLGVWLGMVSDAEMQGKEISAEAQTMVDTVISSLDEMPEETREAMKNAMSPMYEEMQKAEPGLFEKAVGIANGILSRLRKALDINSPSRKTRAIFKYVMQGAELGLEDEEKNLYNQVDAISSGILHQFNGIDVSAWMQKFNDASFKMQTDYAPQVQMANAMAKVTLQTGEPADQSILDYDKFGKAVKQALHDVTVEIDGCAAGRLLTPHIDSNLGAEARRKSRY